MRSFIYSTSEIVDTFAIDDLVQYVPQWLQNLTLPQQIPATLLDPTAVYAQILHGCIISDGHVTKPRGNGNSKIFINCAWHDHSLTLLASVIFSLHNGKRSRLFDLLQYGLVAAVGL